MDVEMGSELWGWKQDHKHRNLEEIVGDGVRIDVVDVSYSVTVNKNTVKHLLRNVNLRLDSGELCALMGPSGAGKRLVPDSI